MSLLTIILTLIVIGVILWLVSLLPIEATIKRIINIVVSGDRGKLLKVAGLWGYLAGVRI